MSHPAITVKPSVDFNTGRIQLETSVKLGEVAATLKRKILETEEKTIRQSLIALGWTPPHGKSMKRTSSNRGIVAAREARTPRGRLGSTPRVFTNFKAWITRIKGTSTYGVWFTQKPTDEWCKGLTGYNPETWEVVEATVHLKS